MNELADMKVLPHLSSLNLQILPMGYGETILDEALYERCLPNFQYIVDAFSQTPLTKLSVPGQTTALSPLWSVMKNLTHLALRNARHLRYVDGVFEHCVQLESLWISCRGHEEKHEITGLFEVLEAHPHVLPHLTHLKLTIHGAYDLPMSALAAFVASKKRLRCLDWDDVTVTATELLPLVTVLPTLPELQVLGLHLRVDDNMVDWVQSGALNAFIPECATALRFGFGYSYEHVPYGRCWGELVSRIGVIHLALLWKWVITGSVTVRSHPEPRLPVGCGSGR